MIDLAAVGRVPMVTEGCCRKRDGLGEDTDNG